MQTNGAWRYNELIQMNWKDFTLVLTDMAIVGGLMEREMNKELNRLNAIGAARWH